MRALSFVMGGSLLLVACGQTADNGNNQVAAAPPAPKKETAYCFFKPEEMKGWTAKRGKDGNITVKGKAHVKDPRYQAVLGTPTVTGASAELSPTLGANTGYEAPGDWWDLNAAIPNSAAVTAVKVTCGGKTVADLKVPPKS